MRATLPREIDDFLRTRGPATGMEIALAVRARRADVDDVLAGDGFQRVPGPGGCSPRATYFNVSYLVPARTTRRQSRADLLLSVIRDGRPHSRREIFERVGFMLTNNAASELRARGLHVEQRRERGNYIYQLVDARAEDSAA